MRDVVVWCEMGVWGCVGRYKKDVVCVCVRVCVRRRDAWCHVV